MPILLPSLASRPYIGAQQAPPFRESEGLAADGDKMVQDPVDSG